tara:strand:+ start:1624 stop:1776 length:153 start_codon:yes stop_codon:yes gene_type:complete
MKYAHEARFVMSATYPGVIPARRTIFRRQSRWPGFPRRLLVVCLVLIATA